MTVLIYQHNMDCIKTEPDPDGEVQFASCSELKHNLDCIKTEPDDDDDDDDYDDDDDDEYSPSCSEIQFVEVKIEEQPYSISFSPANDGIDVSCQCVFCLWHVAVKTSWLFIWYLFVSC
jgi:hypothetical protein